MPTADPRVSLPDTLRQYHIDLAPGELADYILLPGDPERTDRIAGLLDDIELRRRHREFDSVTGTHRGLRVSAVATGIGTDNVEIVMTEVLALTERPTFIRIGSCGVLREDIALGELVISSGAVRLEATTAYFVDEGYPAVADYTAVAALVEAAARVGQPAHVGITATAPGFYGAQGRPIPQLPIRFPDLAERMAAQGVLNFEMEASAVLVLAGLAGCRAGVVCTAFAQRTTGAFVTGEQKQHAEGKLIETGLEALHILAQMDAQRREAGTLHWRPSLWGREMATWRGVRGRGPADVRVAKGAGPHHGPGGIGGFRMAEAYCVKDKTKVEIQNPQQITMKNGKPATKGTCPKCGGSVFRIGG